MTYEATIRTPSGTFRDSGVGGVGVVFEDFDHPDSQDYHQFIEDFLASDGVVPIETRPTSKEQCMDGDYEAFDFKNQGQCVAFVEHGEKEAKGKGGARDGRDNDRPERDGR